MAPARKLRPSVDPARDRVSGPPGAAVTLVEYGDYQCPYCRRAHPGIKRLRDERLPGQLRYVFRHLPNTRLHPQAQLAAEAAEAAAAQGRFWEMHDYLLADDGPMDRDSIIAGAAGLGLDTERFAHELDDHVYAARISEDIAGAVSSGATSTPTFFINGRRYEGPWDEESIWEAMQKPLGLRLRFLAQDFAGLTASSGLMMLLAVLLALLWANSPWRESYAALWETELGIRLGASSLTLSLHRWVNDGLIVIFFLVVGLEIKRELTFGELTEPRKAALPIAAAAGGMLFPALIYSFFNGGGPASHGWGVPMATDTAFALGLLAVLGRRVPISLKIFVAAAAIADDVGAILVIAIFYVRDLSLPSLAIGALLVAFALMLNRARVYVQLPYALVGIGLWMAVLYSGVHPTLAGVLLAFAIPTRSAPDTGGLLGQSEAVFRSLESPLTDEADESRFQSAVRTLEAVVGRLLSPSQRLERDLQAWSSYLILPLFAFANAGVTLSAAAFDLRNPVNLGVILGLIVGKPLGITLGSWLAVQAAGASKPEEISWKQIGGAGLLCGIGFTMSFFIAGVAFTDPARLDSVKLSVMFASALAGATGWAVLRSLPNTDHRTVLVDQTEQPSPSEA